METYFSPDEVPAQFGPSAVTIGKFDGVHAGHRAVVALLQEVAAERGLVSTVVTFDRHPLALLAPEPARRHVRPAPCQASTWPWFERSR